VLKKAGVTFAVAGTHLDLAAEPRLRHVGELRSQLTEFVPSGVPVIVAGDINEPPDQPAWRALAEAGADAFAAVGTGEGLTFPARKPARRIDGVFIGAPLRPVSATVLDSPDVAVASDHCPLLVEIELRP
jgi:endonuclease/exonuclease/phosphatase family metal-dependent hydrolase